MKNTNVYVKTDEFGFVEDDDYRLVKISCDYFTEGKPYPIIGKVLEHRLDKFVGVKTDKGTVAVIAICRNEPSVHTNSYWYFCDEQGNKL